MPDMQLKEYTARIKELIHSERHDEAIAHCRHILRYYPRHIETYCLLGEACLEKGMYREAIEFFQRTLSADPENFIARVGLGIIYGEQGATPEAIWQMERAFELAPGNPEVRRELQRLYAQRDGVEKTRLKLTQGALGRLYMRNGLYELAIDEFRAVLRQDPERPDVRVALAEALWHEGRRLEAVEVCLELLEALPNSLKANLILGEIWLRGGHEEAGEEKLNVARALDPENLVAHEMMGRESPLTPEQVSIPELEVTPDMLRGVVPGKIEEPLGLVWREEAGRPAAAVEKAPPARVVEPWEEAEEIPDWLREIGAAEGETPVRPPTAPVPEEKLFAAEEVPDWLRELVGEGKKPVSEEILPAAGLLEEEIQPEEIPAWLRELEMPKAEEIAPPVAAAVEEEVPAWLRELEVPKAEEIAPPVAGVARAEVPESLRALVEAGILSEADLEAAMAEMTAEELAAQRAEEVPAWLKELVTGEEVPAAEEAAPPVAAAVEEEVPAWLRELEVPKAEEIAPPVAAAVEEEVPAWLRELEMPEAEEVLPAEEMVAPVEEVLPVREAVAPVEEMPLAEAEMVAPFERVEVEEEVAPPSRLDELLARLKSRPRDHQARLELARLYRDEQDWAAALTHYERLISARKFLPAVIEDLVPLLAEGKERARVCQLLGDAYVQEDRLDEALNMYRLARQALLQH